MIFRSSKFQKLNEKICKLKVQFKQKEDEFSEKRKQDEAEINNLKSRLLETFQQNSQNDNNEITKINSQLNSTIQILSRKYKALEIKSKVKIIELTQQNNEKESEIQLLKEQIDQIKIKLQSLPQNKEEKMNNQYKDLFIQCQNLLDLNETKIHSLEEEIGMFGVFRGG